MQLSLNFDRSFKNEDQIIDKKILKYLPYNSLEIKEIINKAHDQILQEDTLGNSLQEIINQIERKNSGQFYTPKEIVDYIIKYLKIKPTSLILDPTCGCGVFLATAYKHLKEINKNALNNLYGVDLNKTAAELTRINLWIQENAKLESLKILEKNIRVGNSITENKIIDKFAFNWNSKFYNELKNGGFDFIIGNPPYITLKKNIDYDESEFSQIIDGPVNAASLIIFRSYSLLKDGGIMAFVLPKTLLRVKSYLKLREFLLNNCKILHIVDLGNYFQDVRGEQIIMFLQKTSNKKEILKNKILVKLLARKNKPISQQKEFYLEQNLLRKYENFLVLEDRRLYSIIEKIKNAGQSLDKYTEIFRGLTLSPSSPLVQRLRNINSVPIIKGENISKLDYKINYFTTFTELGAKIFSQRKIILQNIFSSEAGLIATLELNGYLTFDTVTNVILKNKQVDLEYLLGLFNSKLINFYLTYALFNKSKLTMHTDKHYLGKLPIVIPQEEKNTVIKKLIKKLKNQKNNVALRKELDNHIYNIYKIDEKDQRVINEALYSIMSPKNLW